MVYTLDLPPELAAHPLPALLLQPLVENSIRHGLEPSVSGGEIHIEAQREGDVLTVTVQDNGVGCTVAVNAATDAGFGLRQVRERLATAYGGRGRLDFASEPGRGTTARVVLPCTSPHRRQAG
jgi:sensor histidine kinase YesM